MLPTSGQGKKAINNYGCLNREQMNVMTTNHGLIRTDPPKISNYVFGFPAFFQLFTYLNFLTPSLPSFLITPSLFFDHVRCDL